MYAVTESAGTSFPERVIDAILEAEARLRTSEVTDTPRLEAEVLLADTLGIERSRLIASYSEQVAEKTHVEYFARIMRRAHGEPVAYIIGKKEFMGFSFRVDRRALIPRPETETLVERVLEMASAGECGCGSIADIGAGCGCIAISLALLLPDASVHATDVSEDVINLARLNAKQHRVGRRLAFHVGDACSALPDSLKSRVHIIISNPPYVSDAEYLALDRGIREFEPPLALKGGRDGLDVFRQIVVGAPDFLVPRGLLAVEIGETQAETATDILASTGIFAVTGIVRDLSGRQRVIIGRKTE